MKLFQYAILWHPTEDQADEGVKTKIIVDITTILSKDQSTATMTAFMSIPTDKREELDQIEVVVRPF